MKNKSFYILGLALFSTLAFYTYSCQKETFSDSKTQATESLIEAEDRGAKPFCNLRVTVNSGTHLILCGFGINGNCGPDCSNNLIFGGGGVLGNTYSVQSFPKRFQVSNTGTTAESVNIYWSCGPTFCGGTMNAVSIPPGGKKVFILTNNGSGTCVCEELLCE